MIDRRLAILIASGAIAGSAIFTPAHAEFFGCNTPKVRYYSGTPWSHHVTPRQSYAAASYRGSRPVYHATRHSYRTQW